MDLLPKLPYIYMCKSCALRSCEMNEGPEKYKVARGLFGYAFNGAKCKASNKGSAAFVLSAALFIMNRAVTRKPVALRGIIKSSTLDPL